MPRYSSPAPILFLGGPIHGERREVRGDVQHLVVPVPQPPKVIDYANAARSVFADGPERITYVRKRLAFPRAEKFVTVFAPSGWTDLDLDYALACWIESGT